MRRLQLLTFVVPLLAALACKDVTAPPSPAGSLIRALTSVAPLTELQEGTWSAAGNLNTARFGQTASLLKNGKVLIAGGSDAAGALSSAELYNPATGTWSNTGSMNTGREDYAATLLQNGEVLVIGGRDQGGAFASAELYDPATGTWSHTGSMTAARESFEATLLPNGKVLVTGGVDRTCQAGCGPYASAELYDPATGMWTPTGSMGSPRGSHRAVLLRTGKVLVSGGQDGICSDESCDQGVWASAELYDPAAGTWSPTGSMGTGRDGHTLTLLQDGRVLVVGGGKSGNSACVALAEIYNPATGTWSATGIMTAARCMHTATLLPNGSVLVAGGGSSSTPPLASAELYNPSSGVWTTTASMASVRALHTATLLPGTEGVLVAAGAGSSGMGQAELYTMIVTITFVSTAPNQPLIGSTYAMTATASSGLAVSFTSLTPATCTIAGNTATFVAAGLCTIAADQAGNATYLAAPEQTQSITIITAAQAVLNLTSTIASMGLPAGVANSLSAPLNNINTNNLAAACGKLDAFVNQVNAKVQNGQLTMSAASQLLQAASAIKASLGCM